MIGTIRKHQQWLWAVIITLTIISFVIFFSPYSRVNSGAVPTGGYGSIYGKKVTAQDYANALREVNLHFLFMNRRWPDEDRKESRFDPEREAYQWLLLLQKQEQLGIHVGADVAAQMAQQMVRSFARSPDAAVPAFIQLIGQRGYGVADLERYVRHFIGMQELITAYGLSGRLVTLQEAKALYVREHQEVATEAVFFPASNYLARITVTPDQVSEWYSNRLQNYVIPEKVQVSYVAFAVTNFLPQAEAEMSTNLSQQVELNLQRIGTNNQALYQELGVKTLEEAKVKIREELLRQQSLTLASKKANAFIQGLSAFPTNRSENLETLAGTNGLTVAVTAPFDRGSKPAGLEVGPDFARAAFALTPDEPLAGPIAGKDGIYVIARDKQFARETPALDQIRPKVVEDLRHSEAIRAALKEAVAFYQSLTNGLAEGKSFSNLCAEAQMKTVALPPFSLSTQSLPELEDLASLNQLKQAAFSTEPGKVASVLQMTDGSMVLCVLNKLPVDQAKMQTSLPDFVNAVRRNRQQEAFDDWFRKEAQKGLLETPVFRRPPPELGAGAKS
jgi:hypothetical protein